MRALCLALALAAAVPPRGNPPPPEVSLADLGRFPPPAVVAEALEFAGAYRGALRGRMEVDRHRHELLAEVLEESGRPWAVWCELADAQREDWGYGDGTYPEALRLEALTRLRDLLGAEDYLRGRMPPCVPTWRFRDIDGGP